MEAPQQPENKLPYEIRHPTIDDISFIFNSWLRSYRDAPAVKFVPNNIYFAEQHKVIERILAQPGLRIFVACSDEDPSQIFGYVVGEIDGPVLTMHFYYVKYPYRGFKLATALEMRLLQDAAAAGCSEVVYTHVGKNHEKLIKNRKFTYNPYAIRSK